MLYLSVWNPLICSTQKLALPEKLLLMFTKPYLSLHQGSRVLDSMNAQTIELEI